MSEGGREGGAGGGRGEPGGVRHPRAVRYPPRLGLSAPRSGLRQPRGGPAASPAVAAAARWGRVVLSRAAGRRARRRILSLRWAGAGGKG